MVPLRFLFNSLLTIGYIEFMAETAIKTSERLNDLTVVTFESRMAKKVGKLLEREGATPLLAPSMQEIPLSENSEAFRFFESLQNGNVDILILMTGVGTRTLIETLETRLNRDDIINALNRVKIVVRGPKPTAACKSLGIKIDLSVPEPNTWREILNTLDEDIRLKGKNVAVQEYGIANEDFYEELTLRGATICPVPVYKWALPDDVGPLLEAIEQIIAGSVDLALFTSAHQVVNLLALARERNKEAELRRAMTRVGIVSIGPTTSARLRQAQFFTDLEASPHKLEDLIELAAQSGPQVAAQKRQRAARAWVRVGAGAGSHPGAASNAPTSNYDDTLLLRACRRQPNERIPIWLMRQAGRYMAEYQMVRQKLGFLDLCKNPELAAEVTLSALERLGVDAAIIFADILLPVEPMGIGLDFAKGEGPRILRPVRDIAAIEQLRPVDINESLGFVLEAIRNVRSTMDSRIPLIGFCGAPFTMASYMIEGKGSRNYIPTKTLMHSEPKAWHQLMEKLVAVQIDFLTEQHKAGCQVLQIFDSWVGALSPQDYEEYVLVHVKNLIQSLPKDVPVIHFGTGTATLLELQKQAGGDVIGLDWRMDIGPTWERLGDVAIQGNLDPVILFSDLDVIRAEAKKILDAVGHKPGFIFNLGHGILPETPVDHVMALVDYVHEWKFQQKQ